MGAIFYLVMDLAVHWGVIRRLRADLDIQVWVVITAIALDVLVLTVFILIKLQSDSFVVWISLIAMLFIYIAERLFLRSRRTEHHSDHQKTHHGGSHEN